MLLADQPKTIKLIVFAMSLSVGAVKSVHNTLDQILVHWNTTLYPASTSFVKSAILHRSAAPG